MLSLDHCGFSLLFLSIVTGVSCQELTPLKTEEFSSEGSSVTLSYTYSKKATASDYFYWYQQYPGKPPEILIFHYGTQNKNNSGLSVKVSDDGTRMDLQISSAAVTDSAVYYCAVRGTADKLVFGRGTQLIVDSGDNYLPSYYELTDGNTKACLATGFSRYKATNDHGALKNAFNKTEATRISGDSLYNSVVLLEGAGGQCDKNTGNPNPCVDGLEQDPTVNGVTLTILGLRLLFLKTIIFNVLITLRLWISH